MIATSLRFALGGVLVFALVHVWPRASESPGAGASLEERLVGEALSLGLHRDDAVVRARLVRNMRFVGSDADRGASDLFEQALALRLHESDLVVRRRLAQRLRLAARSAAREQPLDDATLESYLAAHAARFERPARVRLRQVFLSRQRRGDDVDDDAQALLAELRRTGPDAIAPAPGVGDPSLLPARIPLRSVADLAARFGPEFAEGALAAPLGEWSGPLASPFGLHLVLVEARTPARLPPLSEVREAVREAVVNERAAERVRAALEAS